MKISNLLAVVCLLAACNLSDETVTTSSNNATNNATNNTTNNTTNNATTNACATCTDAEVCFEEACCTPATTCGEQCGTITDGCGATIDCGTCGCQDDNFAEFCPTRPCETAVACDENSECVYEAVQCGGSACACAGATCTDSEIRDCRDPGALVCPADFCDPSPTMVNNKVVFQNQCIQPTGAVCDFSNLCAQGACAGATCEEAQCGVCNLGFWDCDPSTTVPTCYDIPLSAASAAETNCNDNTPASTFLYLDHLAGVDAAGSGSRAQPYKTYPSALAAAKQRGAKGIVIRSGLVLTSALELENGISLYGGFSGAPNWKYDGGNLSVDVSTPDTNGNIVAVKARDITERTVLFRVLINSGDATIQKGSSYGIHAVNSVGLVLQEVTVTAGNGANGFGGNEGLRGADGGPGQLGQSNRAPGDGGKNPSCPLANGGQGGVGGPPGNVPGAPGQQSARNIPGGNPGGPQQSGIPGNASNIPPVVGTDGAGGVHQLGVIAEYYEITGAGADAGTPGLEGWGGSGGGGSGGYGIVFGNNFPGAGGGGGGAGGCGGTAGLGGLPGGGSFGIFAIDSTGLEIIASTIKSQNAGAGGTGGKGGGAGGPGAPGNGGTALVSSASGGRGGLAGPGGVGGAGGGGAGGDTFSIFCAGTVVTPVDSTLSFGSFGAGGLSVGADGENGTAAETYNCQ